MNSMGEGGRVSKAICFKRKYTISMLEFLGEMGGGDQVQLIKHLLEAYVFFGTQRSFLHSTPCAGSYNFAVYYSFKLFTYNAFLFWYFWCK